MSVDNDSDTTVLSSSELEKMRLAAEKGIAAGNMLLDDWSRVSEAVSSAILEFESDSSGKLLLLYPRHDYDGNTPAWLSEFLKCYLRITNSEKIRQLSFMIDSYRYQTIIAEVAGENAERRCVVFCFEIEAEEWQKRCVQAFANAYNFAEFSSRQSIDSSEINSIKASVSISSEVNRALKYKDAAVKLVNSVAAEWGVTGVSLGMLKGCGIKIAAISGITIFENKMQLLKDCKDAMLEAIDQDIEVAFPQTAESFAITRSAEELCRKHGVESCLTLPLRYGDKVVGALLLESEKALTSDACESLRIMLELVSSRLVELEERSRWIGGRLLLGLKRFFAILVGSEYTWAKLTALLITGLIIFFIYAKGDYRVDASFVLEPVEKRIVAAPYTSFLKSVKVKPADYVVAGETLLGELETDEILLQRASVFADQLRFVKEEALARSEDKTVESQIAEAKAREAAARMGLMNLKIEQAELLAPVSGYISSREIDLQVGSPLEQGDILFEILPGERLEVFLYVGEGDIADIFVGQEGEVAVMGYPDRKVEIKVFQISPVSELAGDRNSFKVKAELVQSHEWMKPGMEGLAKIDIGERPLIWIWTKPVIDWLRIKLWI